MRLPLKQIKSKKVVSIGLILILVAGATLTYPLSKSFAAGAITNSSVQFGDPRPYSVGPPVAGDDVEYTVNFTFPDTTPIKCIQVAFNDAPTMLGTTPPASMTTTSAVKDTVVGITGVLTDANWTNPGSPTNGILQIQSVGGTARTPSGTSTVTIPFLHVRNTSLATIYAQIKTFSTLAGDACSGEVDESNIMGLVTTGGVAASVTVQNTLALDIANYASHVNGSTAANNVVTTSNTIPFGAIAAGSEKYGAQKATVSTNAAHGYTLYLRNNPQLLTNATNDTIAGVAATAADWDGGLTQSRFGYTIDGVSAVALASNKWLGLQTTNTAIATKAGPISGEDTNVEYRVAISNTQPPGTYNSVVTYTLTPSY